MTDAPNADAGTPTREEVVALQREWNEAWIELADALDVVPVGSWDRLKKAGAAVRDANLALMTDLAAFRALAEEARRFVLHAREYGDVDGLTHYELRLAALAPSARPERRDR